MVDSKMRELVSIAADLKRQKKLQKVVLLQRIPRLDDKSRLSEFSNQAMLQAVCEANDPHGIIVRTLHLGGSQETLFGTPGLRNSKGQLPDGLHLRGPFGRAAFTSAASEREQRSPKMQKAKLPDVRPQSVELSAKECEECYKMWD